MSKIRIRKLWFITKINIHNCNNPLLDRNHVCPLHPPGWRSHTPNGVTATCSCNHGKTAVLVASFCIIFMPTNNVKLVGYVLFWVIYNLSFHPLSKFPGPRLWAISTIPYIRNFTAGECHFTILEMHKKYGPIVRVGPNDLSLNHPDGMKALRGHRKSGTGENSKEPVAASFNADNVIGANRENHQRYRRTLAHGFSQHSMMAQQPIIRVYVDKLMKGLHAASDNGTKPVDIATWYNFTTFDVIGDLAFGEPFGCLDTGKLHPWITLIFAGMKDLAFITTMARTPWLNNLWNLVTPKKSTSEWASHVEMAREKVRKRLASGMDRPDFIDAMLKRTGAAGNVSEPNYAWLHHHADSSQTIGNDF